MKLIKLSALVLFVSVIAASCGNGTPASSTPVDSTNATGAAPVTYGGDSTYPVNEGSYDTGMQHNTMSHEDSVRTGQ